ncbi:hypothetical protein [Streptomyces sp. NPDC052701]|uniref:hypothetical protein n=1 Tax=Streptomyces sp. NPDC052701 TaxID=3155533 RepID=UPI0034132EC6
MPAAGGTGPSPTPAQFRKYARAGGSHCFAANGTDGRAGGGGDGASARVTEWAEAGFRQVTAGSVVLHGLARRTGG